MNKQLRHALKLLESAMFPKNNNNNNNYIYGQIYDASMGKSECQTATICSFSEMFLCHRTNNLYNYAQSCCLLPDTQTLVVFTSSAQLLSAGENGGV